MPLLISLEDMKPLRHTLTNMDEASSVQFSVFNFSKEKSAGLVQRNSLIDLAFMQPLCFCRSLLHFVTCLSLSLSLPAKLARQSCFLSLLSLLG